MRPLRNTIAALRREILESLADRSGAANGIALEPERVVANLSFAIVAPKSEEPGTDPAFVVTESGQNRPGSAHVHSLSIEFRIIPDAASAAEPKAEVVQAKAELKGSSAEEVKQGLAALFGAPGFDSSARATVFREAFEGLSETDLQVLRGALLGKTVVETNPTVRRTLSSLDRVLKSGPAGIGQGRNILANLLHQHGAIELVELVAKVWKSQEDWID